MEFKLYSVQLYFVSEVMVLVQPTIEGIGKRSNFLEGNKP